jgi:hypothetical protein
MRVIVREPHRLSIRFEPLGAFIAGMLCSLTGALCILATREVVPFVFGGVFLAVAVLCFWRMRFVIVTINLQARQVVVQRWGVLGADQERIFPVSTFLGLMLEERRHSFNGEPEGSSYRLAAKTLEGDWPLVQDYDFDRKNKLAAVRLVQAFLDAQEA